MQRIQLTTSIGILATMLSTMPSWGGTWTWDNGQLFTSDWSAAGNWVGNVLPPNNGTADIIMTGLGGFSNVDSGWSLRSLSFQNAGGFTVGGNAVLSLDKTGPLAFEITDSNAGAVTIHCPIQLRGTNFWLCTSPGGFNFTNEIRTTFLSNFDLTLTGTDQFLLDGAIVGGGNLNIIMTYDGSGLTDRVWFRGTAPNTISGTITLHDGNLHLIKTNGSAITNADVVIGDGEFENPDGDVLSVGAANQFQVNPGHLLTINRSGILRFLGSHGATFYDIISNDGTIETDTGEIEILGDYTHNDTGAVFDFSIINSDINLGGGERTFEINDDGNVSTYDTIITGRIDNGSLRKTGAGSLRLQGSTFNDIDTVTVERGHLILNKNLIIAAITGDCIVGGEPSTGPTSLILEQHEQIAGGVEDMLLVRNNATFSLGAFNDSIHNLMLDGGAVTTNGGSLLVATEISTADTLDTSHITANLSLGGTLTNVEVNGLHTLIINGPISNGSLGIVSESDNSLLVLQAANTYTGHTALVSGSLKIDNGTNGSATGTGDVTQTGGVLFGFGTIGGALIQAGGLLSPGDSVGPMFINQLIQTDEATTFMQIDGASLNHDKLFVTGQASVGGTLNVEANQLYFPVLGDQFDFIDAASFNGRFDEINLPAVPSGLMWDLSTLYIDGVIRVVEEACPGDLTDDQMIDQSDLGVLLAAFNMNGNGDLNSDGQTNQADLGILLANFGLSCR